MNFRYVQNNIHSHSPNKTSNSLKLISNGSDYRATFDGKNPAENPNPVVRAPQLLRAVPVHSGVLNSWKEIATYLGRGVRTVQRWEAELQLPVHRPRGKNRSAVIAFREELDQWLAHTPLECDNSANVESSDALHAIAREMQELALQLFAAAESQTRSEKGKLVEAAGTILRRLDVWTNQNSEPSGRDGSPEPRALT